MRNGIRVGLITLLVFGHAAVAREWEDRTGKYKTEAEFVKVEEEKVVLKKSNGRTIRVPLNRLSKKDQDYVRERVGSDSPETRSTSSDGEDPGPLAALKGTLFGNDFHAAVVKMQGNQISFASDDEFFPAKEVELFLFSGGQKLAGRKFIVGPNTRGQSPHIHLKSKEPRKTDIVMSGYAMKLRFGRQQGKTIRGQIDLRIPEHETRLSGTFIIEEPKNYKLPPSDDDVPFIVAELKKPESSAEEDYITAGYVGVTANGKRTSNLAGTSWSDSGYASSLTFKPRVTSVIISRDAVTAQHVSLEPGTLFHYFVWNHSYLVGEFVEVRSDSQINVSMTIDPTEAGTLKVKTSGEEEVRLVPFALSERSEDLDSNTRMMAFQLGLAAEPDGGTATFHPVRAGKYVVVVDEKEQVVEIAPGEDSEMAFD